MKRVLFTAALAAGIAAADACCVAYNHAHPMSLVGEKAIIIWDEEKRMEHFVRQASFAGKAEDVGFIVPTPGMPKVAEADAKAFNTMFALLPPPPANRGAAKGTEAAASLDVTTSVAVLDEYDVGDYRAAILQATDGKSMVEWLKANGYSSRPAMEDWLDFYAKKKWYFAALKLTRDKNSDAVKTSAVRVSFPTDTPHYPYKMPSDTWPRGHVRPLSLFFISRGPTAASYAGSDTPWEARGSFHGSVEPARTTLALQLGLKPEDIPANAEFTYFDNSSNEHGYDRDLVFSVKARPMPMTLPMIGGAALLAGGVIFVGALRTRTRRLA